MLRLCVWLCAALVVACVAAGCCPSASAQPAAAVVSAVRGCAATVGNSTSGCSFNDTIFIYGSNLPSGSNISVLLSGVYYAASVTSYNSSALSARLPYIAVSYDSTYSVRVQNSTVSSNAAALVTYTSQAPVVWRVSGCPVSNAVVNGTSDCQAGMVVTIDGHHFVPATVYPNILGANIGEQPTSACTFVSTTRITCTLPVVSTFDYNIWVYAVVYTGYLASNAAYRVRYASPISSSSTGRFVASSSSGAFSAPSPFIASIAGCALQLGNGTSGCSFNDTIFVYGSNLPTGSSLAVLVSFSNSYYATNVLSYGSNVLSARLPYIDTTVGGTYGVQVRNNTAVSNTVNYVTYASQTPVVWRVSGCPVNNYTGNTTSGCQAGMVVTIDGHHFVPATVYPYILSANIGGQPTYACTFISTTRITCTLPSVSYFNYNTWLYAVVYTGYLQSNSAYLVMYGSPFSSSSTGRFVSSSSTGGIVATPAISAVRGCAVQSGSATSGCNFNDTIFIYGSNLPTGSSITVSLSNYSTYYATSVTSYSSSALSARLPYTPTTSISTYSVQVRNYTVYSNAAALVTYMSQVPGVWRVTGCPVNNYTANSTSGCMSGMVVTIDGHHFLPPNTYQLGLDIANVYTSSCTYVSTSRIQCVLPGIMSAYYNNWVYTRVAAGSYYSNYVYLVRYASPSSSSSSASRRVSSSSTGGANTPSAFISSVAGCALQSGSGISGCNFNDTIVIYGTNLPTGSGVTVMLSGYWYATDVVSYNSNVLSARLPYIAVSYNTVYGVQVRNSTVSSNTANYITYASQVPGVWRVSGCPVNNAIVNTTSGCQAGMVVTIDGHHFVPPGIAFPYGLYVGISGQSSTTCTFISTTRIMCTLPAISSNNYNMWLTAQVWAGNLISNTPYLVMYASPSSTGSAPGSSSSSSTSSLTIDDLIVIVLVVVLVVGLLLLCQVLYCLHHFAGVKFPRLARLTGGRLFAVAEVPAVEGAGVDLSLLAHDHHHLHHQQQQPMLREMHPQPQSAQPPPVAAASYHSPAYYMPAPPAQPAPYQAAHAPAPGPAPFLYPRSFVPSPQYYQAAS